MKQDYKILFVEDMHSDVELIQRHLKKEDVSFIPMVVDNREKFISALGTFMPDIILSDHSLPEFSSIEALQIVKDQNLNIPFILVTGSISEEFAVECIKCGVDDYILKDRLTRLSAAIRSTISRKNTEREKDVITMLNSKLEEAYKEISGSIKYAKRIQNVILTEPDTLQKISEESFILHKPKDIVSGDFFWCAESNDKFIVAVVDCTGHGVPGAFMSIIGNYHLNDIVNNKQITDPSQILYLLNNSIRYVMKQEQEDAKTRDGMDISICCIDKKNRTLEFSGANRPLLYFHNQQFEKINGEKQSIGGFQSTPEKKFSNHKIHFCKGDRIYMSTDGYSDQFGGNNDKKMMTKKFISLLNRVQKFNMKEQKKQLTGWFKEWKGDQEQTDDVLVLGIEL